MRTDSILFKERCTGAIARRIRVMPNKYAATVTSFTDMTN
ncbi:hypothetical protein PAMC26510_05670 [Caballeronia sordidicola]|uniref:Uncharacterized protein n=1 Tax=Caballeronia sordidicola TaxID=196367 RepID=A0A242N7S3_CABSO|nr:hypothetical protein PAMC26577_38000 [Caballeronia sordidicola]OTP79678.1 hypothetical protein PAMC26510_05670 [Caballeronia sordidicola]